MKLIVGLGNPGPRYETTRHNAGFVMLDLLAEKAGIAWERGGRFTGDVGRGALFDRTCLFLKPMTYMNRSGDTVAEAMRFYKVDAGDVVVLHDDIDVPVGKVKARAGGGHGGHNGVRSIVEAVGQVAFHRIKLGVGRPPTGWEGADWVLAPMTDAELMALRNEMLDEVEIRLRGIFDQGKTPAKLGGKAAD